MAKRDFKVGDRVRVYGGIPNADDIILSGATGTVVEVLRAAADGDIKVRFEGLSSGSWNVFSQQCRRLKPRAKSVRVTKAGLHNAVKNARIRLGRTDMAVEYSPVIEEVCRILGLDEESGK